MDSNKSIRSNNYFLVTRDGNGRVKKFRLPGAEDEGIFISVPQKNEKSSALVKIRISHNFTPADSNIFLVMNTAGITGFKKKIGIHKGSEITHIKKRYASGAFSILLLLTDTRPFWRKDGYIMKQSSR